MSMTGPKPWTDKDSVPFQGDGDVDGDDNGAFDTGPGESRSTPPDASETSDTD